jgi:hypothetical protein
MAIDGKAIVRRWFEQVWLSLFKQVNAVTPD